MRYLRQIGIGLIATLAMLAVTLTPASAQPTGSDLPFGNVDRVDVSGNEITVVGWMIDPNTSAPIDVHVYVDGDFALGLRADRARPDVAAVHPAHGADHGFAADISVSDGTHEICAYGIDVGLGDSNPGICRTVEVGGGEGPSPVGTPSTAAKESAGFPGTGAPTYLTDVRVAGHDGFDRLVFEFSDGVPEWSVAYVDGPVRAQPSGMPLHVDGDTYLSVTMSPASGVDLTGDEPEVTYTGATEIDVDLAAIDEVVETGDFESVSEWVAGTTGAAEFGVAELSDPARLVIDVIASGPSRSPKPPFGNLDVVEITDGGATVAGWAIDPDTDEPIAVHVYSDGVFAAATIADGNRPDVGAAHAEFGPLHGFGTVIDLDDGAHEICAYGINVGARAVNTALGCRTVTA